MTLYISAIAERDRIFAEYTSYDSAHRLPNAPSIHALRIVSANIASSISNGTILVEAVEAGADKKMLVETVNSVIDCDADFVEAPVIEAGKNTVPALADQDFDSPRYLYTPALGGLMYINKMSPMPQCVLDLNVANFNGWFEMTYKNLPAVKAAQANAAAAANADAIAAL
jgi:hypothetical protein